MKSFFYYLLLVVVFTAIGWFANVAYNLPRSPGNPIAEIKPRPLEKYAFENLAVAEVKPSNIELGKVINEYPKFTSYEFSVLFDPELNRGEFKKVTGLINIPKGDGPFPLVVMFRGYVDQEIYVTGMGTQHAGEYFAENGFITVAPDFLGYGGSDTESPNIFESRFQTYTTALSVVKSAETKNKDIPYDGKNIFLWGHSNGGAMAIAVLEITGKPYPTSLWAPNSAKFPYSILYYLDEASDEGKLIITKLGEFMADYDVTKYSIRSYLGNINPEANIQLHQGTADDAVPVAWSDSLNSKIKANKVDIEYVKHPGADHNLVPHWNRAVSETLFFYKNHLL